MNKRIRYGDLFQFLRGLGFVRARVEGSHLTYQHPSSGTLFVFPDVAEEQDAASYHLAVVRRHLDENGVLAGDEFDRWLMRTTEQVNGSPRRGASSKKTEV
jgi:predicted RNA binding protein YcfA (HicA-like mRNA interferase family)